MRPFVLCIVVAMLFGMGVVEPVLAAGKKKSPKRRISGRLCRTQEGKRLAMNLLATQASPSLQQLAGLRSGEPEVLDGDDADEVAREDDVPVDIATIRTLWMAFLEGEELPSGLSPRKVMEFVMEWLGRPYRFGGTTEEGIDCSAFMQALFRTCTGALLPRTAQEQFAYGQPIERADQLQFGDLVFFHTRRHAWVSHVGIYLGDNLFAHASSRYGVTISSLESTYYRTRFLGGRRLTLGDLQHLALRSELR
ncbi:MAG: C40 family peptidase [Bacteroidota bacterium]|nr:C40 family peptidase [Candidatus Kapabacteria bacterium]MDW8271768.1 C40 family peptidase [Bacteroidota bacterium]